jgi:hypothetical protein
MANAVFNPAKEGFLDGTIDLDTAVIKAVLVRSYTYAASHKFVSDVTGAGGVLAGTPQTLGTKSVTNGVFDAADVTFTAVAANASGHSVLVYQASAVGGGADVAATAQRVIGYYDTGTLLPVTPNGGDITVAWDNGANKIFALV